MQGANQSQFFPPVSFIITRGNVLANRPSSKFVSRQMGCKYTEEESCNLMGAPDKARLLGRRPFGSDPSTGAIETKLRICDRLLKSKFL